MIQIDAQLARDALRNAGQLEVTVRGGSMGPWIRSGDIVVVEPAMKIAPGEILVFERGGRLIAHRVLRLSGDAWLTRGDAVDHADEVVRADSAVGRVRGLHLRWVHLTRPPGWLRRAVGRVIAKTSPSLNHLRQRAQRARGACADAKVTGRRAAPRSPR